MVVWVGNQGGDGEGQTMTIDIIKELHRIQNELAAMIAQEQDGKLLYD
jgi:hypothetical protein